MGVEKLLNESTVLKNFTISIDDFILVEDDIVTLEINNDFFNFEISGKLKIKDSFDIFNNGEIKFINKNKIKIETTDFLEDRYSRTFYINGIDIIQHNERFKVLDITFIDEISYTLNNTYISKGFTGTPVSALNSYISELQIDDILTTNRMQINIVDSSSSGSFIVPQDRSILDFFKYELKRHNIRMWQDHNTFNISEVIPSKLELQQIDSENVLYTNRTMNNSYIFKIHDYEELNNQGISSNLEKPKELIYRYNNEKNILNTTHNLSDVFSELSMNSLDISTIQTDTSKFSSQSTNSTDKQKYELFDSYMSMNQIVIAVPGSLKYNNIGYVAEIELKGNPLFSDTDHENDSYSSGKYFISGITDRFISGRFIQKLTCIRLDAKEPRRYR